MADSAKVPILAWSHLEGAIKAAGNISLGQGGYGTVYKGCLTGLNVAIKVLSADSMQGQNEFTKEVAVLGGLQHPHLLSLIGCCPEKQALVYPLMEGGSLADRLVAGSSKGPLIWQDRVRITHEVALSLVWLHDRGVVHMDLKPTNVLLDRFGTARVSDVGLAVQQAGSAHTTMQHSTKIKGTIGYLAPEYFRSGKLGPAADVYALGVIMCEMLTSQGPTCTEDIEVACEDGASNTEAYSYLSPLLDPTISWPQHQALQFAGIATSCLKAQKKRPNLQSQLLPQLQALASDAALAASTVATIDSSFMECITCDICGKPLKDPVVTPSGHTFCKGCIEGWLAGHNTCPKTRQPLQLNQLVPNYQLRALLEKINKARTRLSSMILAIPSSTMLQWDVGDTFINNAAGTPLPQAQQQPTICPPSTPPRGEALKKLLLASKVQLRPVDDIRYFDTWKEDSEVTNWQGLEWKMERGEQHLTAMKIINDTYRYWGCGGNLPVSWGSLVSLQRLTLWRVDFAQQDGCTRQLPSEWSTLQELTVLQISRCHGLSGGLPTSWSALTALKQLELTHNGHTGRLPPAWSSLASLTALYLCGNKLDGPLPPEWAALSNLKQLGLYSNKLTRRLPPAWSSLTSLNKLYLDHNQLNGTLPPEWAALSNLNELTLYSNKLTGRLPPQWSGFTSLTELYLDHNQLEGPLPPEWAALSQLEELTLEGNKLSGPVPAEWHQLRRVAVKSSGGADANVVLGIAP